MKHLPPSGSKKSAALCTLTSNFKFKVLGAFLTLGLLFHLNASAQNSNQRPPACNLAGPLQVKLDNLSRNPQSDIVVTAVASSTDAATTFNYTFLKNTSGAVIKSYEAVVYDPIAKTSSQRIVVSSGALRGGFSIKLTATNPDGGQCSCGKSVSVIN